VLGDVNLDHPPNIVTLQTTSAGSQRGTLPTGTGYFLGVIVDPLNEIRELREVGRGPSSELQLVRRVGTVPDLPPAGVLSPPSPVANQFPTPAFAPLKNLPDFLTDPTIVSQNINSTGGGNLTPANVGLDEMALSSTLSTLSVSKSKKSLLP
jgi:hypothetical protein